MDGPGGRTRLGRSGPESGTASGTAADGRTTPGAGHHKAPRWADGPRTGQVAPAAADIPTPAKEARA